MSVAVLVINNFITRAKIKLDAKYSTYSELHWIIKISITSGSYIRIKFRTIFNEN
jgi:hypothetical protein